MNVTRRKDRLRHVVRAACGCVFPLILFVLHPGALCAAGDVETSWSALLKCSDAAVAARQAARQAKREADALELGPWHCVGPFKDAEFGYFVREYNLAFPPEIQAIEAGRDAIDLGSAFDAPRYPGWLETTLRWTPHPEWSNGYYHQLPVGPMPARNEVVYLYRTIDAARATTVTTELLAEDAMRVWLNGRLVGQAYVREGAGRNKRFLSVDLPLEAGPNRLLVKIVSFFSRHGFAMAFPPVAPTDVHKPQGGGSYFVPADLASGRNLFYPGNEPYASERADAPSAARPPWLALRDSWQATMRDSLLALRGERDRLGFQPFASAVLRQADAAQRVRVRVAGLEEVWLICTTGGDNYDFDDSIWADPMFVRADGRAVSLTDLKPASANVGYAELFVNGNLNDKPLQIGERTFERGFWAHAPSALCFRLDGEFEWFEAWIGLDALANVSGSCEFLVQDAPSSSVATSLAWQCLEKEFTSLEARREMRWERADGIWDAFARSGRDEDLREAYLAPLLAALGLDPKENESPWAVLKDDSTDLSTIRALYHKARNRAADLERLRRFHFGIPSLPLYDPPTLPMEEALANAANPTSGALAYLERLGALKAIAARAIDARGEPLPGGDAALGEAVEGIEAMWRETIGSLPPIVFLLRPPAQTNAVSPYRSEASPPASICVFDPSKPDAPPVRIYHDPDGAVFDMNLSFDARTVFFSARRRGVEGGWHIYEIGIDGSGLRQITSGDSNNISPIELPSGEVLFVSDRAGNVLVCQPARAGVLYASRRDGSDVRRVSGNTLSDHTPQMLEDGRVLFTRWDYGVDKGVFMRQGLWTMNPDGTRFQLFYGNTIEDPNAFWEARPVPGRPEVVSTFGAHHTNHSGMLGLIWNGLGQEAPRGEGMRYITYEIPAFYDGNFPHGFQDAFPLNERLFLASYGGDGERRNRLYLLDDRGNRKCIYEHHTLGVWCPLLLEPRQRPPLQPTLSENLQFTYRDPVEANLHPDDNQTGTLLLADVYRGLAPRVERGEIHALQILEQIQKTRPHTGGYAWNVTPTIGRGTFYVRRLIGTVPVESDGSAHFTVPANRDISINALDVEGKAIQRMGSTIQLMPDETLGCIGCHEDRRGAPPGGAMPLAASRPPSRPERPDWGNNGLIDFVRVVQPVFDAHCVKCHSGPDPKAQIDLTGDKTRYFNMAYNHLVDRGFVHHIPMNGADHAHTTPKTLGARVSRLCAFLESDHSGAPLPLEARQRVYTWIDANIPYYHTYLYTDGTVNGARDRWYANREDRWFRKDFLPIFDRRCVGCHARQADTSDAWLGYCAYTVTSKIWTDTTLMDQGLHIEPYIRHAGPAHRINLTHPELSPMLLAPLSREQGGTGLCRDKAGEPGIFSDKNDPDYAAMLRALERGHQTLMERPRVDMLPADIPCEVLELERQAQEK